MKTRVSLKYFVNDCRLRVTRVETVGILQIALAKSDTASGESHHPTFIDNCPTINHTC